MRLHGPSPPQGTDSGRSLLFSLLPPHVQYSPPQGFESGGVSPPFLGDIMAYEDGNIMGYENIDSMGYEG